MRIERDRTPLGLDGAAHRAALIWNRVKLARRLAASKLADNPHLRSISRDASWDALLAGSVDFFRRTLEPCRDEFTWPLSFYFNGFFEIGDLEMYHAMIRRFHPRTVIEVGSGWATRAALEAIRRNGTGRLLCIDPEPRHGLPRAVEYRRAFVERVELELFDTLEANDILFIDSSHTAEEAAYHVQTILPRLKPGVYVHHHDIFYPYAPLYGEEEVLRRYYGTAASAFDLCCGLAFVRERDPDLWRALCPRSRLFPQQVPGSLWSRKRG